MYSTKKNIKVSSWSQASYINHKKRTALKIQHSNFSLLCKYYGHFKFTDKQNQQIVTVLNLLKINRRAVKCNFPKAGCNFKWAEPCLMQLRDFLIDLRKMDLALFHLISGWASWLWNAEKYSTSHINFKVSICILYVLFRCLNSIIF